jgi:putative drug exporter of the RND superfamily
MERLARTCVRRRRWVLAGWVVVVVGLSVLSGIFAGPVGDDYALPGSESERAVTLLEEGGLPARAGTQAQLVFEALPSVDEPEVAADVAAAVDGVRQRLPEAEVVSPLEDAGAQQVSEDRTVGYVAVNLPELSADELSEVVDDLTAVQQGAASAGLRLEVGGLPVEAESEGPPSELVGVVAAVVILLLAFGSVFAMGLPIVVGVVGAAGGVAAVGLAAQVVDMPSFAAPVAAMIAIGVGIDYALLVVTRYREALDADVPVEDAVVEAQQTAGRSVLFAGTIVVIASLGLVLMGLKLITGVALGIAVSVLLTMLAATTLLPALLGATGRRIDRLAVRRRGSPGGDGAAARRWSRQVQKRPAAWAALSGVVLVALALPALDMRLGFSDAGTRPEGDTAREAYDLLATGFGPGTNGPLVLAAETGDPGRRDALEQVAERVANDPGVARVSPVTTSPDGATALVQVVPTTGPRSEATTDLVHRLREETLPAVTVGTGAEVVVGGTTAAAVDFADYTADRLPLFLAVVMGLAMVLLVVVFRGLLVALKAVLVNLLSLGAAFGAVVAVFQWGWGVDLLDLGANGPVEAWAPMMLIAIVFGLSMDYEVFLLSRIKEEYDAGRDNATAVAAGLARTARVITAAAAIMVCVFGSFVLGSSRELQLFGFGLAFAVLVDATVVRMVLVPATMELLGDRNWWLPSWLAARLPHLTIERPVRQETRESELAAR